ncbi:hypothetical protein [Sediminibacterium soli]|uniref:hypothetical protein n=1 Tax=Sediminibacterium soli TaxID=2698829 RepID=UPI00137AC84A|nr:hypothetical protein [Sediminibacterium soli]NCI45919.1 hypothetical protein [Sediminibacterium soli]
MLATEVLGTAFTSEPAMNRRDAINFDLFPRFSSGPTDLLPDINSQLIPKNKMVKNHSSVITVNTLYKPSKTIQIKGIVQYYKDAFEQQQLLKSDYSVSGVNLIVNGNRFSSVALTQFSINTQSIELIRPYLMLQASLEL